MNVVHVHVVILLVRDVGGGGDGGGGGGVVRRAHAGLDWHATIESTDLT